MGDGTEVLVRILATITFLTFLLLAKVFLAAILATSFLVPLEIAAGFLLGLLFLVLVFSLSFEVLLLTVGLSVSAMPFDFERDFKVSLTTLSVSCLI